MTAPLAVPAAAARRLLLHLQGLADPPRRPMRAADCAQLIERLGYVQIDSINTVERAHHMILFARCHNYAQRQLERLHGRDRVLFEGWTHDASLIPIRFYPYWKRRFARERARIDASAWWAERSPDFDQVLERVRRRVEADGALLTRDFAEERDRPSGGWWDWTPSKMALEYLWRTGELAVARRDGFQKVYDLSHRVIPEEHHAPEHEDDAVIDWACTAALDRLGIATPAELADFWGLVTKPEARAWCARQRGRAVVDVMVTGADGKPRPGVAPPDIEARLAAAPPPPDTLRLLSPFDPVIRDRTRLERWFGFDYRIEVFVPEEKRRYGYYVFPLLEGDRFVGRLDMKAQRATGTLTVTALWPERGIRQSRSRRARLDRALERLARFAGVARVVWPEDSAAVSPGGVTLAATVPGQLRSRLRTTVARPNPER